MGKHPLGVRGKLTVSELKGIGHRAVSSWHLTGTRSLQQKKDLPGLLRARVPSVRLTS